MWRKLLYSGFETCFGPSTQGAETKTHLKSRFSAILIRTMCDCVQGYPFQEKLAHVVFVRKHQRGPGPLPLPLPGGGLGIEQVLDVRRRDRCLGIRLDADGAAAQQLALDAACYVLQHLVEGVPDHEHLVHRERRLVGVRAPGLPDQRVNFVIQVRLCKRKVPIFVSTFGFYWFL